MVLLPFWYRVFLSYGNPSKKLFPVAPAHVWQVTSLGWLPLRFFFLFVKFFSCLHTTVTLNNCCNLIWQIVCLHLTNAIQRHILQFIKNLCAQKAEENCQIRDPTSWMYHCQDLYNPRFGGEKVEHSALLMTQTGEKGRHGAAFCVSTKSFSLFSYQLDVGMVYCR